MTKPYKSIHNVNFYVNAAIFNFLVFCHTFIAFTIDWYYQEKDIYVNRRVFMQNNYNSAL